MASMRTATRIFPSLAARPFQAAVRRASTIPGRGLQRGGRRRRGGGSEALKLLGVGAFSAAAYYAYDASSGVAKEQPVPNVVIPKAEVEFEQAEKAQGSSQNRQIKSSIEKPGVFAWGSNVGRVVAPDSKETTIKRPRRIAALDGQLLRDLQLDRDLGVAVTEKGDVLQWGTAFWGEKATATELTATMTGKDIIKVALSKDRVIALSSGGTVYSLPASQSDQQLAAMSSGTTVSTSQPAWWRRILWNSGSTSMPPSSFRIMTPALSWGERVVDVRGGLEHCLLLTSAGRVFSAVSSLVSYPARGQLGLPGVTWETRPKGPLDQPHEVPGLCGIAVSKIAAGDHHSLVLSKDGRVFAFGDNAAGQLGVPVQPSVPFVAQPVELPMQKLYEADGLSEKTRLARPPRVTSIAAGGANSFFTVDAEALVDSPGSSDAAKLQRKTIADTWACGSGLYGNLGTGKWTHISANGPSKVKALSGLAEYSEARGKTVPIGPASLAVGATHAGAVLGNATHVSAPSSTEPSWGSEVLWWGGNEFYQLGTGRRNNECEPVHIGQLEAAAAELKKPNAEMTGQRERLELLPRATVRLGERGKGRKVSTQQHIVCGRFVSAVYLST
ncbi:mitochondrial protein [Grosmannia clavigera kw1407]|uniref:Mitochondrial protein n=1 Tax=Grosmannia clavigera (strain kw1407 / UAMH 11150) TaxID=655863 RepID=F0XN97_GROCL|nr:mitochondrial protein [Grosmannia clavigera kw1407]EFX00782.1 mitochondrial protein [Grosmannia clavigera kw1407]